LASLGGQRAQFTWALRQYNLAEDAERQLHFARRMARYIAAAPSNGFSIEEVTQGQLYPVAEIDRILENEGLRGLEHESPIDAGDVSEGEAAQAIAAAVDQTDVVRLGEGEAAVYAYGYRCAPDRLK